MPEFGSSDDAVLVVTTLAALVVFVAGIVERRRHRANLDQLPMRIGVNGSRGKSTVTRLLTGALAAADRRPLGKTTGTEARLVHGWDGREKSVSRRPEGPNIGEQRLMMRHAVAERADTVVAECMAVTPEYQETFHRELLVPNLLVITNALDDHLEDMGPTADDVADVFAAAIPAGGAVAVTPGRHLERYEAVARERDATLLIAEPAEVDEALLARFEHLVLAEHAALVLAVTRHLGMADDVAIRGMLAAPADPFATRLLPIGDPADPALFVNAFAANDPASTLEIWEHVRRVSRHRPALTVIMNCREDRVDRTRLFIEEVLPRLPIDSLVVMGVTTRSVTAAAAAGDIAHRRLHDLTGADTDSVMNVLRRSLRGRVLLGVGNLHGGAAELIPELEKLAVTDAREIGAA